MARKRPRSSSAANPDNANKRAKVEPPPPQQERRSPNGFLLPERIPPGHKLRDTRGDSWVLGESIGVGGFGDVYSAKSGNKGAKGDYVIKVEPHSNGPLFVEIAFYIRAAKEEQLNRMRAEKGIDFLGIPQFVASGSTVFNGKKLRFLVLPRLGMDLQSVIDASPQRAFPVRTSCQMALQVIDALQYIHEKGYVHKDIKGSNLLLDKRNRLFLVDFGLCSRFAARPYGADRRWAHEGTLEYTARDTHLGCFSRRGDLEVLLYNLIEWLGGKLPWEDDIARERVKPDQVHEAKREAFESPDKFLEQCFNWGKVIRCREKAKANVKYPTLLTDLMHFISVLRFEETPDYDRLRMRFKREMDSDFNEDDDEEIELKIQFESPRNGAKNAQNPEEKCGGDHRHRDSKLRPKVAEEQVDDDHMSLEEYDRIKNERIRRLELESMLNPTPAMLEVIGLRDGQQQQGGEKGKRKRSRKWKNLEPTNLTPAMQNVLRRRKSRMDQSVVSLRRKVDGPLSGSPRRMRKTISANSDQEEPNEPETSSGRGRVKVHAKRRRRLNAGKPQPFEFNNNSDVMMTRSRSGAALTSSPSTVNMNPNFAEQQQQQQESPVSFRNQVSQMVGLVKSFLPSFNRS